MRNVILLSLLFGSLPNLAVAQSDFAEVANSHAYGQTFLAAYHAKNATDSLGNQSVNIPECVAPTNLKVSKYAKEEFVITWSNSNATTEAIEYRVRHRVVDNRQENEWVLEPISQDTAAVIYGVSAGKTYEVAVQRICYWKDGTPVYSDWAFLRVQMPTERVELPAFTCGETFNYPSYPCNSNDLITDTSTQLTVIYIGGFPIEVTTQSYTLDLEGMVLWSGKGIVPLPFGTGKAVKVEWNNARINQDSNICSGSVHGISDDPMYYPNLNPGPLAFGGQICIPPPSTPGFGPDSIHNVTGLPWDENGFGIGGTYIRQPPYPGYYPGAPYDSTGTYDPNGFNVDGIHAQTGTPFNPAGCSQNGLMADGVTSCDPNIPPYSWMNPGSNNPQTQDGLEFAAEVEDSLQIWIVQILESSQYFNEMRRDSQNLLCEDFRSTMSSLVTSAGLSKPFIFGPDSAYFKRGMHLNFAAEPRPMAIPQAPRSIDVVNLEGTHIDLYKCDKQEYVYQHFIDIIEILLTTGLTELTQSIRAEIERLPASTITQFRNNPASFRVWLAEKVVVSIFE